MTPVLRLRIEAPRMEPVERDVHESAVTIGRGIGADIVVSDGSMSRQHARLRRETNGWIIEDLGARNGTFVNGQRVEGHSRVAPGDRIQLGETVVRIAASTATPDPVSPLGGSDLATSIFRPVSEVTAAADARGAEPGRAAARMKTLNEFHRALAAPISLDQLMTLLLDGLFVALRPEEGLVLLRQADGSLKTAASRRLPGAHGDLLVSRRLTAEVMDKGSAALVTDLSIDDRFADAQSIVGAGIRSILAAPIGDGTGALGMVAIYSRAGVRRFGEEDLELLVSLAAAAALRIRNILLTEEAAARRVQDRELALAHDIQMSMLPRRMPERAEVEVAATLVPARAVGGDLYDFEIVGDDLWFVVADAAGKGVSAALFMAITRTLFRGVVSRAATVPEVLSRMNAELARDNDAQFFVTAFVGCLHLATGTLTYATAGHPAALRVSASGAAGLPFAPGIALGILPDASYEPGHVALAPGDLLVAYSDGITDAIDPGGQLFGEQRLVTLVDQSRTDTTQATVDRVIAAVEAFCAGAPQEDDLTLLAIRYRG